MNNHFITKFVKYFLYGYIAILFINIISDALQINLMNDYFVKNLYSESVYEVLAEKNDARVGIVYFFHSLFVLSSFFIIGRWLFVSAKINHLSGIKDLKITPGWSVGWYFIPFANLVMPYKSLKETFKASFNTADWQDIKVPYYFPIWWSTWIIGNFFSSAADLYIESSMGDDYTYEQLNLSSYIYIGADILSIANSFALLKIIKIIHNNQKDKNFKLVLEAENHE